MFGQLLTNKNKFATVPEALFMSDFRPEFVHLNRPLDPKFSPKFYYAKRIFPVTSKCRHMHGVLNVDEIKN
jgi:hypothetical protein